MARRRRRWAIPVVASAVLALAVGAGLVLREVSPASPTERLDPAGGLTSVLGPAPQSGAKTVAFVADVAAHPDASPVRTLLQAYFDAINKGDYPSWSNTVVAQRSRDTTRSAFLNQYRSTVDTDIVVHRLEAWPGGGLMTLISFTSVQDLADAPADLRVRCLRWRVSYPLVREAGQLRLGLASPNTSLREPC